VQPIRPTAFFTHDNLATQIHSDSVVQIQYNPSPVQCSSQTCITGHIAIAKAEDLMKDDVRS